MWDVTCSYIGESCYGWCRTNLQEYSVTGRQSLWDCRTGIFVRLRPQNIQPRMAWTIRELFFSQNKTSKGKKSGVGVVAQCRHPRPSSFCFSPLLPFSCGWLPHAPEMMAVEGVGRGLQPLCIMLVSEKHKLCPRPLSDVGLGLVSYNCVTLATCGYKGGLETVFSWA